MRFCHISNHVSLHASLTRKQTERLPSCFLERKHASRGLHALVRQFYSAPDFPLGKRFPCIKSRYFLQVKDYRSVVRGIKSLFEGIALFLQHLWVTLPSACTFRGVFIIQQLLDLGRTTSDRNFKDFSR